MNQSVTAVAVVCAMAWAGPALAQRSAVVPRAVHDAIVDEVSGDIAFEHMRWFTHYHRPMGGSDGYQAVEQYVEKKAREYGLDEVRVIRLESDTPSWSPTLGELTLTEPYRRRLAFTPEVALSLADYSRPADIANVELVDVGAGTSDADYEGKTVVGKVWQPAALRV